MRENNDGSDPISKFLAQPTHEYEEADSEERGDVATTRQRIGFMRRLRHFMFEKEPSPYSSIAPRSSDGTRTKIFFFNGNGRGR